MSSRQVAAVVGLLIALRVVVLLGTISQLSQERHDYDRLGYDTARYHQIAVTPGTPYRDFEVEVPPVELGAIEALDGPSHRATAIRVGWAMFAVDLLVAAILWIAWGSRATLTYLLLGLPLASLIYSRLDLLSIAFAVAAVAMAARGRERSGGVLLAGAAMAKIWPVVLLPLWLVHRRWRAVTWSVASLAIGTLAWVWWGGWPGPAQVLTFRHAGGWQVQSVVGNVVDLVSRAPSVFEQGADRVGTVPLWARGLLLAGLTSCSAVIWVRASRREPGAVGLEALAAVAAVLVFSSVLSDQYVFWLFPWAAIAAADGDSRVIVPTFLVSFATAAVAFVPGLFHLSMEAEIGALLVLIRNALLAFLLIDALRSLRPKRSGADELFAHDRPEVSQPVAL